MEIAKLLVSMVTPLIVAVIGILLLRRIEGTKAEFTKQSEFHTKWAEQFFECCQEFLKSIERELTILQVISNLDNLDDEFGTKLQKEISLLHVNISETELRIRRSVVFAPSTGKAVTKASHECIELVGNLVKSRKGNFDEIISKMNDFNKAARKAHAEMLGIHT